MDENRNTLMSKKLYISYLVNFLLIFRPYYREISLYIFCLIFIAIIVIKTIRQGNTVAIIFQIISFIIMACGQLFEWNFLCSLGVFLAVINFLILQPQIYHLPKFKHSVGLREGVRKISNTSILNWSEWYPVSSAIESESFSETYKIKWNHTIQFDKMARFMKMEAPLFKLLLKFALSSVNHYELSFSKAKQIKTKRFMLFSHGRTSTPFMYSTFLNFIAHSHKVYAPQHSQVSKTPYQKIEEIKLFREREVKKRGLEIIQLAKNLNLSQQSSIILMGHSYGGSTVLQAYFDMNLSVRRKVQAIVLLDPWLFPLQDHLLEQEITCPILMMANQYFIRIEDVFTRNKKFVKFHQSKIIYLCWKNGDHLHQTDLPFLVGSSLGVIKNIKNSQKLMSNNIEIINDFLKLCTLEDSTDEAKRDKNQALWVFRIQMLQKFKEQIYDISFVPRSWNTSFTF